MLKGSTQSHCLHLKAWCFFCVLSGLLENIYYPSPTHCTFAGMLGFALLEESYAHWVQSFSYRMCPEWSLGLTLKGICKMHLCRYIFMLISIPPPLPPTLCVHHMHWTNHLSSNRWWLLPLGLASQGSEIPSTLHSTACGGSSLSMKLSPHLFSAAAWMSPLVRPPPLLHPGLETGLNLEP